MKNLKRSIQLLIKARTSEGLIAQECINDEISRLMAKPITQQRISRSYHVAHGIYKAALPHITTRESYYLRKQIIEGILKWQS